MKVVYKKPNDSLYKRWFDNDGTFDIWYKDATMIFDYQSEDIPVELKLFLHKWSEKIQEYKKDFVELCPVKLAHIEFIYKDVVYAIYPKTVSATYKTSFLRNEEYEASWDALFEEYQREIRDDLKQQLNVEHSRYFGMLD